MSVLAKIVKKFMRIKFKGWTEGTIAEQRSRMEKNMSFTKIPASVQIRDAGIEGISAQWIEDSQLVHQGVILYLHGGAFCLGSVRIHSDFIARLVCETTYRALALDYRLAPENPHPAALDDVLKAYRWLISQGNNPRNIVMAGDSAGGGLVIAAMLVLRDEQEDLPGAGICISPWVDFTLSGKSMRNRSLYDPLLTREALAMYAEAYFGGKQMDLQAMSPLFKNLQGLPPLLIQVGSDEVLLDDAVRLAEFARSDGVVVNLQIFDGLFHVFHMVSVLPETREALQQIANFLHATAYGGTGRI
jgi:epsilon-lactone hydrolase